jgi:hypothetical protein
MPRTRSASCAAAAKAGLIKMLPQRIIESSTDWHVFNELKRW